MKPSHKVFGSPAAIVMANLKSEGFGRKRHSGGFGDIFSDLTGGLTRQIDQLPTQLEAGVAAQLASDPNVQSQLKTAATRQAVDATASGLVKFWNQYGTATLILGGVSVVILAGLIVHGEDKKHSGA